MVKQDTRQQQGDRGRGKPAEAERDVLERAGAGGVEDRGEVRSSQGPDWNDSRIACSSDLRRGKALRSAPTTTS